MLRGPYTLFTRIPVFVDGEARIFAGELWGKDLLLHFDYIDDFRLCCPVLPLEQATENLVLIRDLNISQIIPIYEDGGLISITKNFIPNFIRVMRAIMKTRIAHSGGAGWAFPLSFYILFLKPIFRFQWVMVIESSFWMKPKSQRPSVRQWLTHWLHEKLLGSALRRADARIFTQRGYQEYFQIETERTLVSPAVWVDEDRIISLNDRQRQLVDLGDGVVRFLFPARMVFDKGPDIVMKAITILDDMISANDCDIMIDLMGEGPFSDQLRSFAEGRSGPVKVRYLEPVSYGDCFFEVLRNYHALLLSNRQDEQPRVIFDAFSQGVPVISSDTTGVRDVTVKDQNALLFELGDADGLAQAMYRFASDKVLRANLTSRALSSAAGKTHSEMHKTRAIFLHKVLQPACC